MRILCTNDDGIHAHGLSVLEQIAKILSDDVWVAAPDREQSGASRALTLSAPVRVRQDGPKRFSISGTPTDCVVLGVLELMDAKPDLVLSGVNHGQNISEDVSLSGTVAGAMQGMQLGIPSIALSQAKSFRGPGTLPWDTPLKFAPGIIKALVDRGWPSDVVMNVNFPDLEPGDIKAIEATRLGRRDERMAHVEKRTDLRGHTYYWVGYGGKKSNPPEGTDLRAIYDGRISVTPLHLEMTHESERTELERTLQNVLPDKA
ncbi:MAG: 5'/3'-nucleotidase SurE [Caulobacterales bacterium]